MGCVYSQPKTSSANSSNADNPRIFHVCNVDDRGTEVNFGKIEITMNELALHQKGKNSIYWSLRSLRRYGFDAQLFSFECGRRCPTGPGIYAFKCVNAEQLFNTLQEAIQQSSQFPVFGSVIGDQTPDIPARYPARATTNPTEIHEYINSPFYVNTAAIAVGSALPTARTDVNTNYAKLDDFLRFYVNIKTPFNGHTDSPPHSPTTPTAEPVNYIMLDLDQSSGQPTVVTTAPATPVSKTPTMDFSTTPPPTPTSMCPPMSYAQIDFERTNQLSRLSNCAANRRKL